ncbi:MAG: efflux RND transporter periplasmic adaptor subunit [Candidatus Zambryskibacteria bacterium]
MKAFFLSKKFLIYAGIAVILISVVAFGLNSGNGKEVAMATRGDITQEVAATGKIKPSQSVSLGFDTSGRVGSVYAMIGDRVTQGQIIAALESGGTSADLAKAKASLLEENIKLREMKDTSPVSYNDASKNLSAAIREGFADADNAVRNRIDQFFKNADTNPQFEISITSGSFVHYFNVPSDTKLEINSDRKKVEEVLNNWQKRTLNLNSTNLASEADAAISDLNFISIFLNKVAGAVNTFSPADFAYETTVNNYKAAVSSARSEVSGTISAIVTAKDKLNSAPTLGQSGQFEDILAQEAKVVQAEANVASLEASLGKSSVSAPFDGIITLQDAKKGEAVLAGAPLISIVSQNDMYVEANISEIHIGKVSVGNPVFITFDAFPAEEFSGEVSYIEPGDVIIDGIVNYKIRVNLAGEETRIKNGLTANLKIQTMKKENVLTLPLYAVTEENGQSFVTKVVGKNVQRVPVLLGIVGNNGAVEVLSGLKEGDAVEF